ncbi:PepSY-associated TM helix domain-containing protein [Rheinheimera sp. MMS21-TC3]|uniref:PepSY-associated TM helix domain-containing protein n=1 Tax=Rheinheimera sp. MMS21-TC3 TaxID=3072790 RepID=UPI0028C4E7B3|nr:PepSY-associated TM helix domain-containing protein [Rheinheimera sp. MMS21-TC3]WNO61985.1 PepSY-associated TM helix domain-containing protein [Rheinheimera sp. MMS21-TC3]
MRIRLGSIRQWHWVSAAVTLIGMLMFAITGITLNHAAAISGNNQLITIEAKVPETELETLRLLPAGDIMLPERLRQYLNSKGVKIAGDTLGQWDGAEFYVAMAKPGADAWLAIDAQYAQFSYERTDRGWVAYFNDLHKGRDTGIVWFWLIDIFALFCVVFCGSGLILLFRQGPHRPMTWPLISLGALVPVVIMLVFI